MYFENSTSFIYSDTLLPDIFISEYLPSMHGDFVKVYIYCLFLSKHNKCISTNELAKKLELDISRVKEILLYLETNNLLIRKEKGISFIDLKEKEIKKLYRPKTTSTPDEAITNSERNKKRNTVMSVINNTFFQGLMSPSWYTDIDSWFDRYKFDEDVMYTLFQHCFDHKGLAKNYITKVAESWHSKNIRTSLDLDKYYMDYQKYKDVKNLIIKKLNLNRCLTEYEEQYVETWVTSYNYDFEIIELVLKRTTGKSNPNFNYLHAVLTDWHKKELKNKNEILTYMNELNNKKSEKNNSQYAIPQHVNFEQRNYSDDEYEKFYSNKVK